MATDEILEALKQIAREKSVDRKLLIETLEAGLLSAARKRYATAADVQVAFDDVTGEIRVRVYKKVVQVAIDLAGEIDYEELTNDLIVRAHPRGKDVHVWTVNDLQEMSLMIGKGVDHIITDEPGKLVRLLEDRTDLSELERFLLKVRALLL